LANFDNITRFPVISWDRQSLPESPYRFHKTSEVCDKSSKSRLTIGKEVGQVGQVPIFIGFRMPRSWSTSPSSSALPVIPWDRQFLPESPYSLHKTAVVWDKSPKSHLTIEKKLAKLAKFQFL